MERVRHYFPDLSARQYEQFDRLVPVYQDWNAKVNVISRQDIGNLEERHVLHSLSIAKAFTFQPGAQLLDLGTGGGFPGVPLAILMPEVQFTLVDGTGKKILVVQAISQALGLTNVRAIHSRAEDLKMNGKFDFVLSRGVAPLDKLLHWSKNLLRRKHVHAYPNGVIALKGGDLKAEIAALPGRGQDYTEIFAIDAFFPEPAFAEKWIVYVQG